MGTLWVAGQEATAALLNQYYGSADTTATTVTAATLQTLSTAYTVPAGEPVAGSAYELTCGGYGQQSSSASQILTFEFFWGSGVGTSPIVGSNNWVVSASFRWSARFVIVCVSPGATAGWWGSASYAMSQTDNNMVVGTAADNTIGWADANQTSHTTSTLATITAKLRANWGTTNGAPTITNTHTTFRKIT